MRGHLEEAKRRCSAAGAMSNALRLKTIEAGLLSEELGAVRADCGRLVQLVRCENMFRAHVHFLTLSLFTNFFLRAFGPCDPLKLGCVRLRRCFIHRFQKRVFPGSS